MTRILIVEDDPTIQELLLADLKLEGYTVVAMEDGLEALEKARSMKPDLIVLDLSLPSMSGYDICRALRQEGSDVPIVMLTARGQETEKVVGLEIGADDYIVKPYGSMELIARIRALLRRHNRQREKIQKIEFADIKVDFKRMEATKAGQPIALTSKEFKMLELLLRYRGEVVTRDQCLEEVWGYEDDEKPSTRTVDTHILQLRQKLSPGAPDSLIASVHGSGYKFIG